MDNELRTISTSLSLQLGYGVGHVLNDVCASLWFTYIIVFFNVVLEFSALQAGKLMLVGQIVDALATPFIGYFSDRTDNPLSRKYGKRKLWHMFGTMCVLGSFPFIFRECMDCTAAHKWAQMYYFAAFIMIFQIGWAAVQISHLSLIPELSDDIHTRTHLTAVRYGFTVFSNLFVYVITWIVLHVAGDPDKQVSPRDAWKFKEIVYIVISVGTIGSFIFYYSVKERQPYRRLEDVDDETDTIHCEFIRRPLLHQVAGVYMCTRLVVNVSQVLIPLYIHLTLGLAARALAVIPLIIYIGSLLAAAVQRMAPRSLTRKPIYLIGTLLSLFGFSWIFFDISYNFKAYYIYLVAVLIGFGGALMLITSLALTADLVGAQTEASAFVYGLMSFTDKLACGLAIFFIQMYAETGDVNYYRHVLSWVCGAGAIAGCTLVLLLPTFSNQNLIANEEDPVHTTEATSELPVDI